MKKVMLLSLCVLVVGIANADLIDWQAAAAGTAGNVVADGTGWTFDGTAGTGVDFDFGALDAIDGKPVDGSTVEFLVNFSDAGSSIGLGYMFGWSPGSEINFFKFEQWNNTEKFGITVPGYWDKTMATDSIFDEDVHVVFVRNGSGTMDLYVNGVFAETEATKTNWRLDGGVGMLGSAPNGNDVPTGTIYGVATYDVALTAGQIAGLAAVAEIPEPATMALLGLGGLALIRRKK